MLNSNWAVIIPMANEEPEFHHFTTELVKVLDELNSGKIYFVVDKVSKDRTLQLCHDLSCKDMRFVTVWAPETRNVVDAYLRGYREAYQAGHDFIIEMDAGMSHDPQAIPIFLDALHQGYECVFGSRFIAGGSIGDSPLKRRLLSQGGTLLANLLLGTRLHDMTSGFQGFHAHALGKLLDYRLLSKAHFYQTEVRYLMRAFKHVEVPIRYRAPSPRVSRNSISNSLSVLRHYFMKRLSGKAVIIDGGKRG
ncbi:glycosyltransferase [Geomonas edaphica]|uniref:glycosyltransferase n=1 Tax=Geomonas edaphica TaxID=2570226 RepID=UPI0018E0BE1C|nr:glycosyltransferase [Geomonas edaphica]